VPATLLWIRASRVFWGIPLGELVPPGKMLVVAVAATAPLCITNGLLFALAWAVQAAAAVKLSDRSLAADSDGSLPPLPHTPSSHDVGGIESRIEVSEAPAPPLPPCGEQCEVLKPAGFRTRFLSFFTRTTDAYIEKRWQAQPLLIYLGEAAGAALGGLCLYFILLPRLPALTTALINALVLWLAAGVLMGWASTDVRRSIRAYLVWGLWLLVGCTVLAAWFHVDALDQRSRRWQWGPNLVAGYDTPYHHLSLVRQQGQISVFANGLWWFSAPDPQTAEYSVHIALLEHSEPRKVLLVGSGIAGMVGEILKHPTVTQVDYVEADPQVLPLVAPHLPPDELAPLHDPRVRLLHVDATTFLRQCREHYDVVLLHCGDPMNLQINRFYTVEFYQRIARVLNRGGLLSFAVGTSADIVGTVPARFLRSVRATLQAVFPDVITVPGENARFLACNQAHRLTTDSQRLIERLRNRGLHVRYIREDTLEDAFNPLRLATLTAVLEQGPTSGDPSWRIPINWDFQPICYFHNLLLWAAQLHGHILQGLLTLQRHQTGWLWSGVSILVVIVLGLFNRSRSRPNTAIGFNVMLVGGVLMCAQIVLLLAFQVFAGFVYRQLALIVALFMVGLALGTAVTSASADHLRRTRLWMASCQSILCVLLIGIAAVLQVFHHWLESPLHGTADLFLTIAFAVLALVLGLLGGMHFSLAVRVLAGTAVASERIGGSLYALDLLGAAGGALVASLFFIPLYGILTTMYLLAAGTGLGLLALLPACRTQPEASATGVGD
jgi:spermidine synthase